MASESVRRITDGIGAALDALGWLLAVASASIGVVLFFGGVYGYVVGIFYCLPLCLIGLGAVAIGRRLTQSSGGSYVEEDNHDDQ